MLAWLACMTHISQLSTVCGLETEAWCRSRHCLSAMSALRSMNEAWLKAS
jgi:hypothetical protein